MKLSIITVVYNNELTITDAIQSVLGQTYKNIEYIIINGQSTDGTLALIKQYKSQIQHLITEPDKGIYDAMNKGLTYATGDVIGILNSDDIYAANDVLESVMNLFLRDPQLQIVYGDLVYVKPDDTNNIVRTWTSRSYYDRYFEDGHVPPHPSLFLKKSVYEKAGNFNINMKLAADYELMLRVFKKYHFKSEYLPKLLVKMRLGGSTNKNVMNIIKGNLEIFNAWKINQLKFPLFLMPYRVFRRLIQFKFRI